MEPNLSFSFEGHLDRLQSYVQSKEDKEIGKKLNDLKEPQNKPPELSPLETKAAIANTIINISEYVNQVFAIKKPENLPAISPEQLSKLKEILNKLPNVVKEPIKVERKSFLDRLIEKIWKPQPSPHAVPNKDINNGLLDKIDVLNKIVEARLTTYNSNKEACGKIIKVIKQYSGQDLSGRLNSDFEELFKSRISDYKKQLYGQLQQTIVSAYLGNIGIPHTLQIALDDIRDRTSDHNSLFTIDAEKEFLKLIFSQLTEETNQNKADCEIIADQLSDQKDLQITTKF